jgi:copper resistance protein B
MRFIKGRIFAVLVSIVPGACWADGSTTDIATDAAPYGAPVQDERVYLHGLLEELEYGAGDDSLSRWDAEGWLGTDENRLWIRSEGEVDPHGRVADGQQEVLYDRPVSSFFDLQAGLRYDLDSAAGRAWAAFGIEGLAPQFVHLAATGYVGDEGHLAGKLRASYETLLTQRWVLEPEAEVNVYSHDDPSRRIGAGLADLDAGLRLRYEIRRKLAPYVGIGYQRSFGHTAQYARVVGDAVGNCRILVGIRGWF